MVGPVHSCDRCTRNSHLFLHSTLPRPLLQSAAPSGCPSELCASLLHGQVDAEECHRVPSPGPQRRWPWWLTAKALPVLALGHTEPPHLFKDVVQGTAFRGTKTWASRLSLGYHHRHLRSRALPWISWVFCCSYSSASSPSRLPSLAGVAPVATRSIPAVCRSVPQSPENATEDCSSHYTSTACCQRPLVDSARSMYLCVSLPELSSQSPIDRVTPTADSEHLTFLEAESPRCQQGRSLLGLALWLQTFPVSSCALASVFVCVLVSFSYKDTSYVGPGPSYMTSL